MYTANIVGSGACIFSHEKGLQLQWKAKEHAPGASHLVQQIGIGQVFIIPACIQQTKTQVKRNKQARDGRIDKNWPKLRPWFMRKHIRRRGPQNRSVHSRLASRQTSRETTTKREERNEGAGVTQREQLTAVSIDTTSCQSLQIPWSWSNSDCCPNRISQSRKTIPFCHYISGHLATFFEPTIRHL